MRRLIFFCVVFLAIATAQANVCIDGAPAPEGCGKMSYLIPGVERGKRGVHQSPEKGENLGGSGKGRRYRPPVERGEPEGGGGSGFAGAFFKSMGVFAEYVSGEAQAIPNDELTVIDFSSKIADSHNAVTTGAGWRFTAPASGFYQGSVSAMLSASAGWVNGELFYLTLRKNGSSYRTLQRTGFLAGGGTSLYTPQVGSAFGVWLVTGEYLDVVAYQNSGSNLNLHDSTLYNSIAIFSMG